MLFINKLRTMAWGGAVSLLLSLSLVDSALAITAEQQQMLQNLSPAQRAALASQYGGGAQVTTRSLPATAPAAAAAVPTVEDADAARDTNRIFDGKMRVLGDDTLLLNVVQQADVLQETPDSILRLQGKSIHQLDKGGVFNIDGLPGIPLLGLNVPEIEARLAAEPAFRGFAVNVQILPVEPYDVGALKPFGYDFFNGAAHVSLSADMPIPSNYPIGPGDVVNIQLFGKQNANYSLQVNRDGQLDFPELGPITVAGLTFSQLKSKIQGQVGQQMIGVTPNITMGQLRSIQIFIAGEVNRPGTYTISALSTVTNAILASGGVKETGSLRKVQVKRSGKTVNTLDLYDLLLNGDSGKDITLQQGDVVFIPPVGSTVSVVGEVKRPAIYELKKETTVAQIVELAGGELPTSFISSTKLERIKESGERTVVDVDLKHAPSAATLVRNGDVVRVPSILELPVDIVTLEGHVYRPGFNQWREGMRISDVVPDPTMLRPRPDMEYGLILREVGPERNILAIDFRPSKVFAEPKSVADLLLLPRDKLYFFGVTQSRKDTVAPILTVLRSQATLGAPEKVVAISGEVRHGGQYPFTEGMRIGDLVRAAGGFVQSAYDAKSATGTDVMRAGQYGVLVRTEGPNHAITVIDINPEQLFKEPTPERDLLLQPRDRVLLFGPNAPREGELESILNTLRGQAYANEPERSVSVTGLVRYPGQYPLSTNMKVSHLLRAAGGLVQAAYGFEAEIIHLVVRDGKRMTGRSVVDLASLASGSESADLELKPFDVLNIRQIPQWREKESIQIFGEVRFPGNYVIRDGETLRDVIERAGGLTNLAYPRGAVFTREELRKKEQENIDQLKTRLRQDVAAISLEQAQNSPDQAQSIAMSNSLLSQLESAKAAGRLVIDLPAIVEDDSEFDIVLKEGDKLYVPKRPEEVTIIGEVNYPTSHFWDEDLSRDEYIDRSGGLTYRADEDRIYVVRANGEVAATKIHRFWFNGKPGVETGDVIVVPLDAERIRPLTLWTNVSQIFYQIGVAAAAWKTIGVF